jgi:glycine/D-amino acid oxidase-like deaminating enzyme
MAAAGTSVVIVGAGIFGLSGALALRQRNYEVTVVDPGPVPHPVAASNDISKMVRMDYGADRLYSLLAAEAIEGWRQWNDRWGREVYHEDGFLLLSSHSLDQGGFERDSYETLTGEGWALQRLEPGSIARRFPGWNAEHYVDGYLNPRAGWAEAAAATSYLAGDAAASGVTIRTGFTAASVLRDGGRAVGVSDAGGAEVRADQVVVAAGVWTPVLLPELQGFMSLVGQPIYYFRPPDPERFRGPHFPPWGADLPRSGWYGFPANAEGVVKVSNHGPGHPVPSDAPRVLQPGDEAQVREFLSRSYPELANEPLADSKMCIYCDTWDGDFLIGRDPELEGLVVATGGSGHAFKFTPALGRLVADAVEGKSNPYSERFAWRERGEAKKEDARYAGDEP